MENFTITCLNDFIDIKFSSTGQPVVNLFYKLNNQSLKQYDLNTQIHLEKDDSVSFINQLEESLIDLENYITLKAKGGGLIQISGDLSSLNRKPLFNNLFTNCQNLVNAENLKFDFDTVEPYSCYRMFQGCKHLLKGLKELKPDTLAEYCYQQMFANCYSLQSIPSLPATTLANWCYMNMFDSCYQLKELNNIILPAKELKESSYRAMFINCYNLTSAPRLAFHITYFFSCAYMFANCPKLEIAPALIAQNLEDSCYDHMFDGCKSLRRVRVFFEQWQGEGNVDWLRNVSKTGTFVKTKQLDDTLKDSSHIPVGWEIKISNCTREQVQSLLLKQ